MGFATEEQAAQIWEAIERNREYDAEKMPDEQSALLVMGKVHSRLEALGWKDATYCPKDGTVFDAIEFGSTGIHDCFYEGEWPNGRWWIIDDNDLWPARPVLFRLKPDNS